jgi:hypothetical protein
MNRTRSSMAMGAMDGAGSAIISSRHLKVKAPGVWPLLHIPGRSLEPRGLIARPRQGGDGSRRSQDSGAATDVPPAHNRKTDPVLDAGPRTDRRQPWIFTASITRYVVANRGCLDDRVFRADATAMLPDPSILKSRPNDALVRHTKTFNL